MNETKMRIKEELSARNGQRLLFLWVKCIN